MDETTTEATVETGATVQGIQVDDQGQAVAEPETTETTEAVETEEQQEKPKAEPSEDEQLTSWAEKKGLTLDSDNAKKAAKMAREAEKAMHQKAQRASELEKNLSSTSDQIAENVAQTTGQDPELLKRVQRVEVRDAVRDFYDQHPDARELESAMVTELTNRPHLAGDLEALYAVVKTKNLDAVKSQGGREALESLAHKQQAAVPRGNAVNSVTSPQTITPQNVDQLVAQNNLEWFQKNHDAINRAMAG